MITGVLEGVCSLCSEEFLIMVPECDSPSDTLVTLDRTITAIRIYHQCRVQPEGI
jgi:hypothetical protein